MYPNQSRTSKLRRHFLIIIFERMALIVCAFEPVDSPRPGFGLDKDGSEILATRQRDQHDVFFALVEGGCTFSTVTIVPASSYLQQPTWSWASVDLFSNACTRSLSSQPRNSITAFHIFVTFVTCRENGRNGWQDIDA